MNTLSYKTISANKETANKEWVVVDAKDKILGRFASQVVNVVKGKTKTNYTPHVDCGDNVIIINADKIRLTGKKMKEKQYVRHTGYPGGQRFATPELLMSKDPRKVLEIAIRGMLPKTRLGREQFRNVYVYAGSEHPHEAQKPKTIEI